MPFCSRMQVAATLLVGLVRVSLAQQSTVTPCDWSCQDQQRDALNQLYTALNAPNSLTQPAPELSTGASTPSLPPHCAWPGVFCCSSAMTVQPLWDFPSTVPISCSSTFGVVALILARAGLSGSIPLDVLPPLAPSLQYLSFSGITILCSDASVQML